MILRQNSLMTCFNHYVTSYYYVSLTFLFKIVSLLDGGHLGFPGRNDIIMSN